MAPAPGEGPQIRLQFTGVTRPHGVFVGPAPWFRISGGSILQGPDGDLVAETRHHQWVVRDLVFSRLDCRQPHSLGFEDASGQSVEETGQFGECAVIDGVIFAEGAVVATWVAESALWVSADSEIGWPVVVIRAVESPHDYPFGFQRRSGPRSDR
jgi:hypothetical protein